MFGVECGLKQIPMEVMPRYDKARAPSAHSAHLNTPLNVPSMRK